MKQIVSRRGTTSEQYHLSELRIASSENDPRKVLPSIPQSCRRILDVGCGAGQTLIASKTASPAFLCGIDIDLPALQLGRQLAPNISFVLATGESIPFQANSFDMLICRVTLPYLRIEKALDEFYRVLNPGGVLWLVLHPVSQTFTEIWQSFRGGNIRDLLFRFYVIANSLTTHTVGYQFHFPLGQKRMESFQTSWGIRKSLL